MKEARCSLWTASLGTCIKVVLFIVNRCMKYERISLLLGYPWAIFCSKLGGLGQHPRGEFFFVDRGIFVKIAIFANLCKL